MVPQKISLKFMSEILLNFVFSLNKNMEHPKTNPFSEFLYDRHNVREIKEKKDEIK